MKAQKAIDAALVGIIISLASFLEHWFYPFSLIAGGISTITGITDIDTLVAILSIIFGLLLIIRNKIRDDEKRGKNK